MIIHLKKEATDQIAAEISEAHEGVTLDRNGVKHIIISSKVKTLDTKYEAVVDEVFVFENDMQLSSKAYLSQKGIQVGDITIGGDSRNTVIVAGPCSVESKEQITVTAKLMKTLGIRFLRGGCYKPRTSPYTFQGLGREGLKLLAEVREEYQLMIVTEIRDTTHADEVLEYTDIAQIGAKSMYDHGILKICAKSDKPILLKRGFGTTVQEFLQAAEFILSGGNEKVILCERGIRTFETKTRFTLDLCGVAYLKEYSNLPIFLDPSHAMGYAYGVADLTRACMAMGVDGLIIETHPTPKLAKSDASQQLDHPTFTQLHQSLTGLAKTIGKTLI